MTKCEGTKPIQNDTYAKLSIYNIIQLYLPILSTINVGFFIYLFFHNRLPHSNIVPWLTEFGPEKF